MDVERLQRLDLFAELDYHDLTHVARWAREVQAAAGDVLFEQDSIPYDLFVLETGTVDVIQDGELLATLGPGDPVGEMSLLRLERRMATVRAKSEVTAVAIPAEDIALMQEEMPEVVRALRDVMETRRRRNEER
jgi:CRP/FNR family cyclic AMP-dependent transcriptional regulator